MKLFIRISAILALVLVLFGVAGNLVFAQNYPRHVGYVNDFADILARDTEISLENRLSALEKDTSAEVAFVSVYTIGDSTIEDYAAGLFQDWGIGKKSQNNGVLFLVTLAENDIRIEVGYGLESIITDGRAGRILDDDVLPFLEKGDFDGAIEAGVIAIEKYIRDGTSPIPVVEDNPVQNAISHFDLPFPLLIGLGVFSMYVLGFMARTKSVWLGGIWGIILGLILGFGFGSLFLIIALPIGMGFLGTILDVILSRNYNGRKTNGMSTGWFSSGGGFKGSGGGFGGFGGGMSGGGGASRHF
jgi:uncharacterized protein